MKIVCDKNMPYAAEAFGTLGKVMLKDGRQIAPMTCDAELLITRSTTRINAGCLTAARCASMGSA